MLEILSVLLDYKNLKKKTNDWRLYILIAYELNKFQQIYVDFSYFEFLLCYMIKIHSNTMRNKYEKKMNSGK